MDKRWRLYLYVAVVLVSRFGASLVSPVTPYFVLSLGIDMKTYGLIGTAARGFSLLMRIPTAALVPSIGYFRSEGLAIAFLGASRGLYALSAALGGSLVLFAAAYVLSFTQFPFSRVTRVSIVSRYVEAERRSTALGVLASLTTVVTMLGPLLGGYLYEDLSLGFTEVYSVSLLLVVASTPLLVPLVLRDETASPGSKAESFVYYVKAMPDLLKAPGLSRALLILAIDGFAWSLVHDYVSIYLAEYLDARPTELALANMVMSGVTLLGFMGAGYVSDRAGCRVPFLVLSEICGLAYFTLLVLAGDMTLVYAAYAFMGFTIAFWGPVAVAYMSEIGEKYRSDSVPLVIGVWGFTSSIARLPGSLIGGYIFDIFGPKFLFELVIAMLVVETFLLTLLREV